jgi:hypothetical protein
MTKRSLLLPFALLTVLAACGRTDSPETATDSVLAAVPPAPQNPHVVGFDLGRQVEPSGRITGGTTDRFKPSDSIFVSVRAQYTKAGDDLSVRLRHHRFDERQTGGPGFDWLGHGAVHLR